MFIQLRGQAYVDLEEIGAVNIGEKCRAYMKGSERAFLLASEHEARAILHLIGAKHAIVDPREQCDRFLANSENGNRGREWVRRVPTGYSS